MGWTKKYKFSELYEMSSGISSKPEQAGHGEDFLSFSTVFNNYFLPDELPDKMDTSEKEQKVYSILAGDIFLTRTSETIDELGMSSVALKEYPKATYSGFLKRLRATQTDVTYAKYLGFYLRSDLFRKTMTNNAIMTLRASLNEQIFSYLDLLLPEFDEQKKIGDYLLSLNQKIELNNKINAELEAMAKLTYDYWFVQFDFPDEKGKPYKSSGGKMVYNDELNREIPEEWERGTVGDLGKVLAGGTPSTKEPAYFTDDGIAWLTPKDLSVTSDKYIAKGATDITELGMKKSSANLMPAGSVVLTTRAPIGYIGVALNEVTTNQGFKSVVPKSEIGTEYVYETIKLVTPQLLIMGTGSTFKEISKEVFVGVNVVIPAQDILKRYQEVVKPISERRKVAEKENQELASLRDWLLPMLMNGQVKVGEGKEVVKAIEE
jgi:type I restriction enzyme S subunit